MTEYESSMDEFRDMEAEINKILRNGMESAYNAVESWVLVVRASRNNGDGDQAYGAMFMPPDQDAFTTAGLRWLFDEGIKGRFSSME